MRRKALGITGIWLLLVTASALAMEALAPVHYPHQDKVMRAAV